MKLTENQIGNIQAALKKIGFLYVDILHEMTDHIAAELEQAEGDFDRNLRRYIYTHKKELRRFNREYIFGAWAQSCKVLMRNILSVRFAAFFGLVFLALTGLNSIMERDPFITLMFCGFCFANGAVSFPEVYRMIKKQDQYSAGEGLAILNIFVFFPGLFLIRPLEEGSSDTMIVLYFTVLISACAVMAVTKRHFKTNYKLRYNG